MAAAKKTEEPKVTIELKGVKAKLQTARIMLMDKGLKKSGKNDFAHFEFFQLKDFLPEAQRIFTRLGLTSNFTIMPRVIDVIVSNDGQSREPIIKDIAKLVITDIESKEEEVFEMEAENVVIGNNTKQNIYQAAGGRSTYYKRYLYRDALEIEEDDESDMVIGQPDVNYQAPQPTPYDFQPQAGPIPAPIPESIPVQQVIVDSSMGQPAQINEQGNVEVVNNQPTGNPNDLISQQSKEEVMTMILGKGLNGFEVINNYCQQNGIGSPSELKESDKAGLIAYVGTL